MMIGSSSSESSGSSEKAKKKSKKKKDKSDGKAKKQSKKKSKKDKKESKKANKLAKQIQKLEGKVEKRRRQMNGEKIEKKKRKKSSSSSSDSAKAFKAKRHDCEERVNSNLEGAGKEVRSRLCPSCKNQLQWSDVADGDYAEDWLCNNVEACGSSGSSRRTRWRWNCLSCVSDFCRDCYGMPEGWEPPSDDDWVGRPRSASQQASRPSSPRSPSPLPSPSSEEEEESDPEIHIGFACDNCDACPIKGVRFKCATCKDVNLCKRCWKQRLTIHHSKHKFLAMKAIPVTETNSLASPIKEDHAPAVSEMPSEAAAPVDLTDDAIDESLDLRHTSEAPEARTSVSAAASEVLAVPPATEEAPEVVEMTPDLPSKMHEQWQNIGKSYATSLNDEVKEILEASRNNQIKKNKKRGAKTTAVTLGLAKPSIPGKRLVKGMPCHLCLHPAADSWGRGVACSYMRPDGSFGGCQKGVCFPCMKVASRTMFGKVKISKEAWDVLGEKAWWMHEKCMGADDESDYSAMLKSANLSCDDLPDGWEKKTSKSTGKMYYVNEKLGKTQWKSPKLATPGKSANRNEPAVSVSDTKLDDTFNHDSTETTQKNETENLTEL